MNNNRGNNNRRRGRGNNNRPQGGGGGGQQTNRIDSRARGNAPQLLEKYRKLAQDAHMNGDRVQAEYYLQFADHYFRVLADARVRQDESRARRDDRWQENGDAPRDDADDGTDFSADNDFPSFDTPPVYTRREREDRNNNAGNASANGNASVNHNGNAGHNANANTSANGNGDTRRRDETAAREVSVEVAPEATGESETANETVYEPAENPFVREGRSTRGLRPRREDRRPRREEQGDRPAREEREPAASPVADGFGLEASLPPSISLGRRAPEPEVEAVPEDATPAPKRRVRRKPASDTGETLESVG